MLKGDKDEKAPGGIRLGSSALTTRGLFERDIKRVVDFIVESIDIAKRINEESKGDEEQFDQLVSQDSELVNLKLDV